MTTRRSYNARHADWVAKVRRKNPEMAALWGHELPPYSEQVERDLALEETCRRLFGKVPMSKAEKYDAEQAIDARQVLKGRGED